MELTWRTSSSCEATSCVAVARDGDVILVRDTKQDGGPVLRFTLEEWEAFRLGVLAGEFDFQEVPA